MRYFLFLHHKKIYQGFQIFSKSKKTGENNSNFKYISSHINLELFLFLLTFSAETLLLPGHNDRKKTLKITLKIDLIFEVVCFQLNSKCIETL